MIDDLRDALRSLAGARGYALWTVAFMAAGIALATPLLGLFRTGSLLPPRLEGRLVPDHVPGFRWDIAWASEAIMPGAIVNGELRGLETVLLLFATFAVAVTCITLALLGARRAADRWHEIAVRRAVGATRRRVRREVRIEALLLGACGAGLGLGLGGIALDRIRASWPGSTPSGSIAGPLPLLAAATLVAVVLVSAAAPLRLVRRRSGRRGRGRSGAAPANTGALPAVHGAEPQRLLAGLQVALLLGLLAAAGLALGGTRAEIEFGDPGYDPRDTVLVSLAAGDPEAARSRIAALPGVRAVRLASPGVLLGLGPEDFAIASCDCVRGAMAVPYIGTRVRHHAVETGLLGILGVPLLRGRAFRASDRAGGPPVALINETFARSFADPTGEELILGRDAPVGPRHQIVGVIGDIRPPGLGSADPAPAVYLLAGQHPPERARLVVRTEPGLQRTPAGPALVRAITSGGSPGHGARAVWVTDLLADHAAPLRWFAVILAGVACGVLALATGGVYGFVSYDFELRRREIGIRRALGARRRDIFRLVVGEAFVLVAAGGAAGLIPAAGLGRGVGALVEGVEPFDLRLYAVLALVLGCTAVAGALVPAFRAARASPMEAIRTG